MKAANYLMIQLVQILHKLQITEKPINISFIIVKADVSIAKNLFI